MSSLAPIHGRWPGLLWTAASLERRSAWRRALPTRVADEFLSYLQGDWEVTAASFRWDPARLPHMAALGQELRDQLQIGDGLCWLRGLASLGLSPLQEQCLLAAMGWAIGEPMLQPEGLHPTVRTTPPTGPHTAGSFLDAVPDLVGMLCDPTDSRGGNVRASNALQLYHFMRIDHAPILGLLEQPWIRDLALEHEGDRATLLHNRFPIYSRSERPGGVLFRYLRSRIEAGQSTAGSPLTAAAKSAFDLLDELLSSPERTVSCNLEQGDIIWFNNHTIAIDWTGQRGTASGSSLRQMWVRAVAGP